MPTPSTLQDLGLVLQSAITDGVYVYGITDDMPVQDKVGILSALANVEYAEPDGIVTVGGIGGGIAGAI